MLGHGHGPFADPLVPYSPNRALEYHMENPKNPPSGGQPRLTEAQLRHIDSIAPFVNDIRSRLFSHVPVGRAAVMIGAGFSRNAIPLRPDAPKLPLWYGLSSALRDELYPEGHTNQQSREQADRLSPLRLAQEYYDTFGAEKLDDLIRRKLPDGEHAPGPLHQLLLSLPWCEIFTTNYDTLLERCAEETAEISYSVINTPDDIPNATAPKIVKLHGSFPSSRPFILTEEHFRRYPAQLASFVVLVQQSIMTNAFVLLGFSGDDPNFLSWSGWVRDTLGRSCPPIYLCGCLDLTDPAKNVLSKRNVIPIDLSPLFPRSEYFDEDRRQSDALRWLLCALRSAKPYDPRDWPNCPESPSNNDLPPFPSLPVAPPRPEHDVKTVAEWTATLEHNRLLYPGYAIAPKRVRRAADVLGRTLGVLRELPAAPNSVDMLRLLYETDWRLRVAMTSIAHLYEKYEAALGSINPFGIELSEYASPALVFTAENANKIRWGDIRKQWMSIALSTLRYLRESGEPRASWERRKETVSSILGFFPNSDLTAEYLAEVCLEALERGDDEVARDTLSRWSFGSTDPIWDLRRSSLLFLLGDIEKASFIVHSTRVRIRRALARAPSSIYLLSRAEWADRGVGIVEHCVRFGQANLSWHESSPESAHEPESKLFGFRAGDLLDEIRSTVKSARQESGVSVGKGFLPHSRQPKLQIYGEGAGMEVIKFLQDVPLPPRVCLANDTFTVDLVKGLTGWLPRTSYSLVLGLVWKSLDRDALKEWLTRFVVGLLPQEVSKSTLGRCMSILKAGGSAVSWSGRLKAQLGVASLFLGRMGLLAEVSERAEYFAQILTLLKRLPAPSRRLAQFHRFDPVYSSFREALASLWATLDLLSAERFVDEICQLPLEDRFDLHHLFDGRSDLAGLNPVCIAPKTISWLFESLFASDDGGQRIAGERLLHLCSFGLLSDDSTQRLIAWAWPDGGNFKLDPEHVLFLPTQYRRTEERRLRKLVKGKSGTEWSNRNPLSFMRFMSLSCDKESKKCLVKWHVGEAAAFLKILSGWWQSNCEEQFKALRDEMFGQIGASPLMAQTLRAVALILLPLSLKTERLRLELKPLLSILAEAPFYGSSFRCFLRAIGTKNDRFRISEEMCRGLESHNFLTLSATFYGLWQLEILRSGGVVEVHRLDLIENLLFSRVRLRSPQLGTVLRGIVEQRRAS